MTKEQIIKRLGLINKLRKELKNRGPADLEVKIATLEKEVDYDLYVIPSSIVCYESEIEVIKKLNAKKKNIFVIGPFASSKPELYTDYGAKVISGESEFYFNDFKLKNFVAKIIWKENK